MKGSRRYARVLAMKGLYHWQVNQVEVEKIIEVLITEEEYPKADVNYTRSLLESAINNSLRYYKDIESCLDRPISQISPIEKAILLIAMVELGETSEVPFKVVINECVELAKQFGGTDGHKYINGVLDRYLKGCRAAQS
ncbi:MAG: transcription antitermination factor NusB [Proteobacteria bacterium]|nr:transcription antitermination factor NusB [Pseudomonadota bacterium]